MKRLISILPHITIILSLMFITLWILDKFNPLMNFLDSRLSNLLLLILFVSAILTSVVAIIYDRKLDHKD